uniref:Uncharacterized protein n=1 Tax=Rhizophagus irregularis (strain DAOM 181602 / DAOM 197198 / MUCL 43194) TaxID=747089 RepID=U9TUI2_RHIID
MCRAIINAGACERGSQPDIKEWNNTLAREFCGNEKNISKHICVSTNSTIHGPDLDGELNWIVNRTSNLGDSCQSCTCCDERKQCIRLPVNCAHACNSTTVLNNCKSLPNQHSKTGTGKEITDDGRLKAPLLYKSEVCDFTVPSNNTNPNGIGTDSGLSTSDKIGIVFGVLSFIVGVIETRRITFTINDTDFTIFNFFLSCNTLENNNCVAYDPNRPKPLNNIVFIVHIINSLLIKQFVKNSYHDFLMRIEFMDKINIISML